MVGEAGEQYGVMSTEEARRMAESKELDLLLVSETADPPVCKLVNFGQFLYKQKKKDRQSKRSVQVTKELKVSPKISTHDYQVRLNKAIEFLKKRNKIRFSVFFKGREIVHQDLGQNIIERFILDVQELGVPDSGVIKAGKSLVVVVNPK